MMETTRYANELAARLLRDEPHGESRELLVALLRELAKGQPVRQGKLAATLGWSAERVAALLAQEPSTEYDGEGNVIGYGISLRETEHAFEIDGRRLYTWCALDALMFPVLIGKTATVLSRCPTTGLRISLSVSPEGVRDVEPGSAVVTLPPPAKAGNIRSSFCCHVHFYASASAAHQAESKHPGIEVLGIEDAFCLGCGIANLLATGTVSTMAQTTCSCERPTRLDHLERPPPIACSLNAQEMESRFVEISALANRSLLSHEQDGRTLRLRYAFDATKDLERLVQQERQCCGFLQFAIDQKPDAVHLTITAPLEAGEFTPLLCSHFIGRDPSG